MTYEQYIVSEEWRQLKIDILTQKGMKCEGCGARRSHPKYLHIHHLHYKTLFNERACDLQVLCGSCHQMAHGLIPTPQQIKAKKAAKRAKMLAQKEEKRKAAQKKLRAEKLRKIDQRERRWCKSKGIAYR